jgi:HAE1 family hydrophobic/amphiphilic exporter-1
LAIRRRPELRQITLRGESNDIRKSVAADQLKPKVDLIGSYFSSGLAGSLLTQSNPFSESSLVTTRRLNELSALAGLPPLPPPTFGGVPSSLVGGYGSNLQNMFGGSYQSVQVGLAMDWNVRNRTAEAELSQTAVAERRLRLERERWEQVISAQVRNALQALQTAVQRISAAEAGARAAKEKLDSETRLFQAGESTNFFVLTRQNDYTDSLRRLLVSKLDYNKALALLHQATGTTLEVHRISVN